MNIPQKDLKVKDILCIWGRLLYLSAVQNLELEHVINDSSLVHIDGAMNRTDKSSLMRKLKKKIGNLDKQNVYV